MKDISDLTKKAIATLYLKGWTHKELVSLFELTRHIVNKIISKNVVEQTTVYKKEVEDLYPEFNRCMVILDTNVLEMRSDTRSQILSDKRCAIFLKMAERKSNYDCYKIVGLLGRGREVIYMYHKNRKRKEVKELLLKLN